MRPVFSIHPSHILMLNILSIGKLLQYQFNPINREASKFILMLPAPQNLLSPTFYFLFFNTRFYPSSWLRCPSHLAQVSLFFSNLPLDKHRRHFFGFSCVLSALRFSERLSNNNSNSGKSKSERRVNKSRTSASFSGCPASFSTC